MIKGIIFDWDGVIADSCVLVYEHLRELCLKTRKEFTFGTYENFQNLYKEPFTEMYKDLGFNWEKERYEIGDHYTEYTLKKGVNPYPGIVAQVLQFSKKGFKLGIASSSRKKILEKKLADFGLSNIFQAIVTIESVGTDSNKIKPAPDSILLCLQELGLEKHEAVYIGDMPTDIQAAKKAGVKSIAVSWGYMPRAKLEKENPDWIIDAPNELGKIFPALELISVE